MKVFCILGDERVHNARSTSIFSTVIKRAGLNWSYVPFKVNQGQVGHAMTALKILNIAGANVTVPYKEAVLPHMDVLSEGANIIGSVNAITINDGKLKGYNTNAIGFMNALEATGFETAGKTALVIGTGGAAKAVAFILNWLRSDAVFIAGRDERRIEEVTNRIEGKGFLINDLPSEKLAPDIVVNATSVSSTEESPELSELISGLELPGCELIFDINYGRSQNFWEDTAKAKGIKFVDGLTMIAYQASRSFELWTKKKIELEEFLKAIENA